MAIAELQLPTRLLAGGGPSTPDARVLRALTTPLIGQFDPDFTAVMDDVVQLARATFLTGSPHCFAISALASGGLEAALNTLLEDHVQVAIAGSPAFVRSTAELVRRLGAEPVAPDGDVTYFVAPLIDPFSGTRVDVAELAAYAHARDARLIVEATAGLGACELRVDDWGIDLCVAGADYALGAPSGMSLVTYSAEIHARMQQRAEPPRTSYLDLLQLQAYWSPQRLNHHTAPTSLVYGLREALRLLQLEGLEQRWQRHADIGRMLHDGLTALKFGTPSPHSAEGEPLADGPGPRGLDVRGDPPYAIVPLPTSVDEEHAWRRMLEEFGVHVTRLPARQWRLGLLGADAQMASVHYVLGALEKVLAT